MACFWLLSALPLVIAFAQAETPVYEPPTSVLEPALPEGHPECPEGAVDTYEGSEDAAGEVRLLRGELRSLCRVVAGWSDVTRERLWWLIAETVTATEQHGELAEQLQAPLSVKLSGQELEQPLPVSDADVAEASEGVAVSIDASGEAQREALWFLIGLAVALFGAYALYRQVMPRG